MIIIAYLGGSVKEYLERYQDLAAALRISCPNHPNQTMVKHARYTRGIKETGEKISIQRLICRECNSTVSLLPDFLLPYKQYSANEIESVIIDSETTGIYEIDTPASVYTVRRWIKEMSGQITAWISMLKTLLIGVYGLGYSEAALAGLPLIEQIRELSKKLPRIKHSGNLLGYAGIYAASHPVPV